MSSKYLIRSAGLSGFATLVNELGGDVDSLLARVNLTLKDIEDSENLIPYEAFVNILEYAANDLNCLDFGIRLASYQNFAVLGMLGSLMQSCETVREALGCAQKYFALHNHSSASWIISEDDNLAYLTRYEQVPLNAHANQYRELVLTLSVKLLRYLINKPLIGAYLDFSHDRISPKLTYKRATHIDINFNQENERVVFSNKYLNMPIQKGDSYTSKRLEANIVAILKTHENDTVKQVSLLILQTMCRQKHSIENIAKLMSLHPRKLQRKLKKENQTFKKILNKIRIDSASWHLQSSDKSITQISEILGYKNISAFSRTFKAQKYCSALQWRKINR